MNLLDAALAYAEQGFSVIPLHGKVCPIQWSVYQTKAATFGQIHQWHKNGLLQNIGIVCGEVSGKLAVIDLDGLESVREFYQTFPHLVETYRVNTGSGKGQHVYFYVDQMSPTTRAVGLSIGNIELRAEGAYVVAPPSVHPETKMRYVSVGRFIRPVGNLDNVARWIESLRPRPTLTKQSMVVRNSTAYGRAALHDECEKVRWSNEGARNNQLYRSALKLGTLAQRGHLSESEIESALLSAAAHLSADDSEGASQRTIQSGLRNAQNNGERGQRSQA